MPIEPDMTSGPGQERAAAFLQSCVDQMDTSRQWFMKHILPLSPDQLRWRPQTGCWSIGECLDHLSLTLAHYLPKIEQSVGEHSRAGQNHGALLPFPESEREYLRHLEPPVSRQATAPLALQPTAAVDPDRIVDEFTDLRERYARIGRLASGVDLAGIRIRGSLHLPVESVGGVLALLAAHDRRHIWQVDRVRSRRGFPV